MAVAVEVQPHVVQRGDHAGIRASLEEHGYALVRNCATESELQRARALLWQHLDAAHGWKEGRPETWTDDAYGGNRGLAGIMTSTRHSDCFWFVRTLPGVLDSFAAVYGTTDLVAAYDNMAINRPASCGQESVASLGNGVKQWCFSRFVAVRLANPKIITTIAARRGSRIQMGSQPPQPFQPG